MASPSLPLGPTRVELLEEGVRMEAPPGIVYSTGPVAASDTLGTLYVCKGTGDAETIAAECVGYMLAEAVGVSVPGFAIAETVAGEVAFASEMVLDGSRNAEPFLAEYGAQLASVVVLDVWLMNDDRNMGGLLPVVDSDAVTFKAIDFEKSQIVRSRYPLVGLAEKDKPRNFWPSGQLGTALVGRMNPTSAIDVCSGLPDQQITGIVEAVAGALPAYDWSAETADALIRRRKDLERHVRGAWR